MSWLVKYECVLLLSHISMPISVMLQFDNIGRYVVSTLLLYSY